MHHIIPDSSFYILFLYDIEVPEILVKLLSSDTLKFHILKKVKEEVRQSPNYQKIEVLLETNTTIKDSIHFEEALRPFLAWDEIQKGEDEVIAISIIFFQLNIPFITIIDDQSPKEFLEKNFPDLYKQHVVGSIGFIKKACCELKVLNKEESLNSLKKISNSKFWIKKEVVEKTMESIMGC